MRGVGVGVEEGEGDERRRRRKGKEGEGQRHFVKPIDTLSLRRMNKYMNKYIVNHQCEPSV